MKSPKRGRSAGSREIMALGIEGIGLRQAGFQDDIDASERLKAVAGFRQIDLGRQENDGAREAADRAREGAMIIAAARFPPAERPETTILPGAYLSRSPR